MDSIKKLPVRVATNIDFSLTAKKSSSSIESDNMNNNNNHDINQASGATVYNMKTHINGKNKNNVLNKNGLSDRKNPLPRLRQHPPKKVR